MPDMLGIHMPMDTWDMDMDYMASKNYQSIAAGTRMNQTKSLKYWQNISMENSTCYVFSQRTIVTEI